MSKTDTPKSQGSKSPRNGKTSNKTSKKASQRKRHRILALTASVAVAVVIFLVIAIIVVIVRAPKDVSPSEGQAPVPTTPTGPTRPGSKPRPAFQSADCPDVQTMIIPGTWESSPTDDPLNPTEFPKSLLLNVSRPLGEKFDKSRLQTWTVPYTAQFHNPFADDNQMSYNTSRKEGTDKALEQLTSMNERCPLTSYVLVGFSQGAVIAGDIASQIGQGMGPVDQDLVLGVALIADGRRQQGVGQFVGPNPAGQGAEVTLGDLGILDSFGLKMTGPRKGGFGDLADRTYEICAPGDLICAAPPDAFNISNIGRTLDILTGGGGAPVHALYGTTEFWQLDGQPATVWATTWADQLIEKAPKPKHG